jgi:hypothetical protein
MRQAEEVTGFMRGRFGDVLGAALAKIFGEDPAGVGGDAGESTDVAVSAVDAAGPCAVAADHDACDAEIGIDPRVDGGDVDVKRGIFFGDTGPDFVDAVQFLIVEGAGVAVEVVGGGLGDVVWAPALRVSADEIEIEFDAGAGMAGELGGAGERIGDRRRGGDAVVDLPAGNGFERVGVTGAVEERARLQRLNQRGMAANCQERPSGQH